MNLGSRVKVKNFICSTENLILPRESRITAIPSKAYIAKHIILPNDSNRF
ncbi:hypothetical protein Stok01_00470 [Sulfurisphaera tokodaii]